MRLPAFLKAPMWLHMRHDDYRAFDLMSWLMAASAFTCCRVLFVQVRCFCKSIVFELRRAPLMAIGAHLHSSVRERERQPFRSRLKAFPQGLYSWWSHSASQSWKPILIAIIAIQAISTKSSMQCLLLPLHRQVLCFNPHHYYFKDDGRNG